MKIKTTIFILICIQFSVKSQMQHDFSNYKFYNDFNLTFASFDSLVDFSFAHFSKNGLFNAVKFNSKSNFQWVTFDSIADFSLAQFTLHSSFDQTRFTGKADFKESSFLSEADFSNTVFKIRPDFSYCHFNGKLIFENSRFEQAPDFYNALLPDTLILRKMSTSTLDLSNTLKADNQFKTAIDLREFPINRLKVRWKNFRLYYPSDSTLDFEEIKGVYLDLLKRFDDLGYQASRDLCYKEYKSFLYKNDPKYFRFGIIEVGKFSNWIDKYWWGYGIDLYRIILNTLLLLSFFTVINTFIFWNLNESTYKIENIYQSAKSRPNLKPLYAFFYTSFIFFGVSLNLSNLEFKKIGKVIWLMFQFVAGLICLAFVVNHLFN